MRHVLQRHPFAVEAFFRHSLVLTYACAAERLAPLLPAGLMLDTHQGFGFLAIALVQTQRLHPSWMPGWFGRPAFLAGFRLFVRRADAPSRRGLYILKSLTDRRWMRCGGNLFTHYRYILCRSRVCESEGGLQWTVRTNDGRNDLDVTVPSLQHSAALPAGSPFADEREARRFAGPLPYTFDYEAETHSLVSIRGVRREWNPQPVGVVVRRNTFVDGPLFRGAMPTLANAFYVRDLPYRWERGVRTPL